mmetsp:Transcript_90949/g.291666  ORF Transcript_90949/g.291666 Transcript_90949/m.291666 type:complete len:413 (+) Transcript_90949:173-1411(+)
MCALPMEASVRDALQPQEDFDQFLQGLMVDTTKKLEEIRAGGAEMGKLTAVDPPATAPTLLRRPLRAAAEKPTDPEQEWREQVKQRKAHERQCRVEEAVAAAAAAAELAGRPAHVTELTGEEAQLARARSLWAAEAKVREGARASEAAAQREQEEQWRAAEWEPLLAQRREDLRAKREEAERCCREETSAAAQALQRERCSMVAEDTTGKSFRRTVAAECERRAAAGAPLERDQAVFVDVKAVLRMRRSELLHQDALEEQKAKAEQQRLREQEMQKECEYREWRQHVRAERCLQEVQKDLAPPRAADIREPRRPDPQELEHTQADDGCLSGARAGAAIGAGGTLHVVMGDVAAETCRGLRFEVLLRRRVSSRRAVARPARPWRRRGAVLSCSAARKPRSNHRRWNRSCGMRC